MIARYVNWDLVERKHRRMSEDFYRHQMRRLMQFPTAIRGRPAPRWEEMTDAEVGEAVGLTETEVRTLESRCAPEVPSIGAVPSPDPQPGGG